MGAAFRRDITGHVQPERERLYFNSQRGNVLGISYEARGPFRTAANQP